MRGRLIEIERELCFVRFGLRRANQVLKEVLVRTCDDGDDGNWSKCGEVGGGGGSLIVRYNRYTERARCDQRPF